MILIDYQGFAIVSMIVFNTPLRAYIETCFLLPGGSDSRRVYAVTAPDPSEEYPVLVIDVDDQPYTALMYPGFDVYMAALTGMIDQPEKYYADLFDDPRYAERLQWHAETLFQGKRDLDYGCDEEWMRQLLSLDEGWMHRLYADA